MHPTAFLCAAPASPPCRCPICPFCFSFLRRIRCHVPEMLSRVSTANQESTGLTWPRHAALGRRHYAHPDVQGAADNVTILVLQSVLRGLRRLHCQVLGLGLVWACLTCVSSCTILPVDFASAEYGWSKDSPSLCRTALPCSWRGARALPSAIVQALSIASTLRCVSDSKAATGHNSARFIGSGALSAAARQPQSDPDLLETDGLHASSLASSLATGVADARPLMLKSTRPIVHGSSTQQNVMFGMASCRAFRTATSRRPMSCTWTERFV